MYFNIRWHALLVYQMIDTCTCAILCCVSRYKGFCSDDQRGYTDFDIEQATLLSQTLCYVVEVYCRQVLREIFNPPGSFE